MTTPEIKQMIKELDLKIFHVESWLPEDKPEALLSLYRLYVYKPVKIAHMADKEVYSAFYIGYWANVRENAEENQENLAYEYAHRLTKNSEDVMFYVIENAVSLPEKTKESLSVELEEIIGKYPSDYYSDYSVMGLIAECLRDMEYGGELYISVLDGMLVVEGN